MAAGLTVFRNKLMATGGGSPPADIFASLFPVASAPTYNWADNRTATGITQTARAGVAPGGLDAVEFTVSGATGQPAAGWFANTSDIPSAGESRYVRFRMRCTAASHTGTTDWKNTILETGTSGARVISIALVEPDGDLSGIFAQRNVDGAPSRTSPELSLAFNTWGAFQYEIFWHPTNAFLKYWLNNGTYASPSAQSTGTFTLNSPEFGYQLDFPIVALNLQASGSWTIQVADYHYSASFDAAWT